MTIVGGKTGGEEVGRKEGLRGEIRAFFVGKGKKKMVAMSTKSLGDNEEKSNKKAKLEGGARQKMNPGGGKRAC